MSAGQAQCSPIPNIRSRTEKSYVRTCLVFRLLAFAMVTVVPTTYRLSLFACSRLLLRKTRYIRPGTLSNGTSEYGLEIGLMRGCCGFSILRCFRTLSGRPARGVKDDADATIGLEAVDSKKPGSLKKERKKTDERQAILQTSLVSSAKAEAARGMYSLEV
jgi:hypothetical protein